MSCQLRAFDNVEKNLHTKIKKEKNYNRNRIKKIDIDKNMIVFRKTSIKPTKKKTQETSNDDHIPLNPSDK
jgi:hypothetical protein